LNEAEKGGIVVEGRDGVRRGYSRRMGKEHRTWGKTIRTHHFFSKMIAVVLISDSRRSPPWYTRASSPIHLQDSPIPLQDYLAAVFSP